MKHTSKPTAKKTPRKPRRRQQRRAFRKRFKAFFNQPDSEDMDYYQTDENEAKEPEENAIDE